MNLDLARKAAEGEIAAFSPRLGEVLSLLLAEVRETREEARRADEARKRELEEWAGELAKRMEEETERTREVLRRENEQRQAEIRCGSYREIAEIRHGKRGGVGV